MSDEEVLCVSEALDAVGRIADPEARVRAMSQAMADQVRRQPDWQEQRRQLVFKLRNEDMSIQRQDILRGYSSSGLHRPLAVERNPPTVPGELQPLRWSRLNLMLSVHRSAWWCSRTPMALA